MRSRRPLALGILLVVALAALGAAWALRSVPPAPASAPPAAPPPPAGSTAPVDAPAPSPAANPPAATSTAPTPALEALLRELDLVRPPRPQAAAPLDAPRLDGGRFRLTEQRGRVVLVNFWATWCPPCREEMPSMERLWRRARDTGFVLVGVSVDADSAPVAAFVRELGLTFPVALDPEMRAASAWGVRALPASFLVDREGRLVALALGPRTWDGRAARALVEALAR